ncbi:hypothetical protein G7046_g1402 [Stylonectria norvegica]|nr:hypothetical protein G7046_g1402 [Stylonectria norvegica]
MKVLALLVASLQAVAALTIAEINGDSFLSPYKGQNVTGVEGLVTAVSSAGVYLRSTRPDRNSATSEGLYVFGSSVHGKVAVGDVITLNGRVDEYRSNADYIYLTELTAATNITVVSSANKVKPLIIGKDTSTPPTKQYSSLDDGDVFGVPNALTRISVANPKLKPRSYGLDFWESLSGELVTIKGAYAVSRPNSFGDVWVRSNWKVTGLNRHGGLTMLDGDANPEAIIIGSPVDGSKNPDDTKMGDYIGDITGVVSNAFGFYRILPLTAAKPTKPASAAYPAVGFASKGSCKGITVGDYNAENLSPSAAHMPLVIDQIVHKLLTPDVLFLQEVQDNSGATNDGVVSANVTLATLVAGIEAASGVVYDFVDVDPENNQDGGQPGGNIRTAFLYRPDVVELYQPNAGGSLEANEVLAGPTLNRKPLVAMWRPVKGTKKPFFTVNVHFTSKGGSSSLHGDPRTPVNKGVEKRTAQAQITADFIAQILKEDRKAHVITAGDFNEFVQVEPLQVFRQASGLVELDELVHMPLAERYTYLFDMNCEALDHMFVSKNLGGSARYEHLHLNTWQNFDDQVSDHDPSVARFDLC